MPLTPADLDAVQRRAHDATVGVMRSEEFQQRLRAAVAAVVPDIVEAVLAAEVPEHPELTGAARRLGIAIRDTRIIARRIQDAV